MNDSQWQTAHLSELEAIPGPEGVTLRPIRRRFGIEAFGMNAWTADAGENVIENHTEETFRHQEVYLVAEGHATFTLGEETVDAPTGTLVFVRDYTVRRSAVATEDGTTIVAVGAKPGEPFEESAWEYSFAADPLIRSGDFEGGLAIMREAYDRQKDEAGFVYNLACFESLAGHHDQAVEHLRRAFELEPEKARGWAEGDTDLDPIRSHPRFPA